MGELLDQQPQDGAKLQEFHSLASGLVTTPPLAPEDAGQQAAITGDTAAVFGHAAAMSKTPVNNAEGIPNPFTTLWNGAREVMRSMSYYEMKNRAGIIGRNGLGPHARQARRRRPRDPHPPHGAQLRRPARRLFALRPAACRDRRGRARSRRCT